MVVAANRDEHYDRPSAPPAMINAHPAILAGRDLRAGGTWLGVNEHGLLAGILNRRSDGEQSPRPGVRSRGLLCLDILALTTAAAAGAFVRAQQNDYQPFTLLCADADDAWSAYNHDGRIITTILDPGIHVFSSAGEKNARSDKRDRAYRRFAQIAKNLHADATGSAGDFLRLQTVLADHAVGDGSDDPRDAICMHGEIAGTVSSSIIVHSPRERRFRTFHCPGAPCRNDFSLAINLDLR
jgi:uncharacterized protein with NRDE domain